MQSKKQRMISKYDRCMDCDKVLPKQTIRRQNKTRCENCKRYKLKQKRKISQEGWKESVYVEEESFFEDDPKAIKEKDYGKISRNQTQVMSKTIMDDFG
jgi:uncharacterized protein with PIN domain|tara:strand:- start:2886 stop:3182 length:297 start_codon:yes stop_codon:yes gene_type:complete